MSLRVRVCFVCMFGWSAGSCVLAVSVVAVFLCMFVDLFGV